VPASARRKPSSVSTVEVLPASLGPRRATTSPESAAKLMPSTATRLRNGTTRWSTSTAGIAERLSGVGADLAVGARAPRGWSVWQISAAGTRTCIPRPRIVVMSTGLEGSCSIARLSR